MEEKGGGVLGALGTHAFDMLHWLFGASDKVSGDIITSIPFRPNGDKLCKVTSEDVCLANIQISKDYKNIPCQVSLSSISKKGSGFSLQIYGKNGSIFLKSENQQDYVHGFTLSYVNQNNELITLNAREEFLFKKTWGDGRIAPVKRIQELWAKSINEKIPIVPGLNEGVMSQKVCDAIKESAKTGVTVKI